ncbi:M6 family metalloprotease domain-containing protein [Muribaculaceae bacterium Isolate-002 (NCI)]|nr:M6 family metalloprotease domain-containing protein [Muribaculaceae bacterium Isolate-002 (NCI)]
MRKLRHIATICALVTALGAIAVPAKRITFTATQPDGTQLTLTRAGDEFHKYFLTDDGQIVVGDETKGYYFAEADATGRMTASHIKAADKASRTAAQAAFVAAIDRASLDEAMTATACKSRLAQRAQERSYAPRSKASLPAQSGVGLFPGTTYPNMGSPKGLIILVEYSDVKFNTSYDAGDYFSRMISEKGFSDYNGTGSALDWFTDASMGQFTPDFDVYGPVTLSQRQAYYGGNDRYGDDLRPEEMVIEGCTLLDKDVDFSIYDTDGDGYVDNVFVFYAGRGEADGGTANTVWPHQWEIESAGKTLTLDGVKINRYACSNEWDGTKPDGIGTFVHEFSHVMGLPDLYHTSASVYYTPCEWSVMDYGPYSNDSRTPPTYSIFERNAMGWIDPLVLDKTPRSVELTHIAESNYGCIIQTSKSTEFFLLENRQQEGWDKYLPGHGMLIWHIDYNTAIWRNNSVNNTKSHQYVDIEEANNNPDGSNLSALANWAFPGTSGQYTEFTDNTVPNMKTWAGASLGIPVTGITETDGVITFDVCGGTPAVDAPTAVMPTGDEIGTDYFIASWNAVDGAVDYLLTVSALGELVTTTDTNNFGSSSLITLPSGWSSSHTKTYTSSGNYGNASPSMRMEANYYVQTPRYDYPVTQISFWAKGQGTGTSGSSATLYAVDGNSETPLTVFKDWNTGKGATITYTIPRSDVYQLKLVYDNKVSGNLAIDDMTVTTSSEGASVIPAYNSMSTGGATRVRVDNLPEGKAEFRYTVVAVNGENKKSAASNAVDVKLGSASIDGIATDNDNAPVEYYNLQGIRVDNPAGGIYIRRQGSRVEKVIK